MLQEAPELLGLTSIPSGLIYQESSGGRLKLDGVRQVRKCVKLELATWLLGQAVRTSVWVAGLY